MFLKDQEKFLFKPKKIEVKYKGPKPPLRVLYYPIKKDLSKVKGGAQNPLRALRYPFKISWR